VLIVKANNDTDGTFRN